MKTLITTTLLFVALSVQAVYAQTYDVKEIMRAVVRIEGDKFFGSGTVFSEKDESYFILTNAHVVDTSKVVSVDFFREGKMVKRVKGAVKWRHMNHERHEDLAIVEVKKSVLDGLVPNIIKLAPKDRRVKNGELIYSIGLPHAKWPMFWLGRMRDNEKYKGNNLIDFDPNPFSGQSGSALFITIDGKPRIVGIIAWKSRDDRVVKGVLQGHGIAMHVSLLYNLIGDKKDESSNTPEKQVEPLQFKPR